MAYNGMATASWTMTPSNFPGTTEENADTYDVENAKEYLDASGVDPSSVTFSIAEGDYTASIGGYTSSNLLSYVVGVYHSSSINASNKTRLNDPEVDALIDQAKTTLDEEERVAILEQLSAKLNEICSQVPLYQPLTLRAYDSGLQGVEVSDSGTLYFEDVYWEE